MKIYLVGGAVRDSLLNLPIKDKDWVVVGGTEKILLEKNFQQVGKDFPVFLHPETHEEYALARKERKSGRGHTSFETDCNINVTLEEDLVRRDLTINAIAQDQYGNYIDPFQGKKDIKYRLIRHISESFTEDPLRVLRVARFAASLVHLGFKVAKETMLLMSIVVKKKELSYLTSNRIWNETEKAFKTSNPHVYFQVLYACNALHFFFPEIYFLHEKKIFLNYSFLKQSYNKNTILMGLAEISLHHKNIDIRFSYLCQFLSINRIDKNYSKTFFDSYSAAIIHNLCKRFNIPSYIRDIAVLYTGFYFFLNTVHCQSSKNIIIFFSKIDAWRKPERIKKLAFLSDFNFLSKFTSKFLYLNSGCFLKKCFSIVKSVSIKLILKKGFKGHAIKNELIRLRIKKLELWRLKNVKYRSYL
ncbi:tRNA CCA-pyrophosphorylase [Buchnera aphidicola str. Ak (Acyrthosiphon kondoi)]|uniref:CCA-adding enzyme n=1 Tax=Buchnera aphidicola str. Ak (Acyrthosiphon kondoi) TaxID=1005090 RepID=G2LME1_9GAMM|nr:tRNA CCA-pyrophosphorylase [Buchnera aphidicola]AEO08429.1 tRNA CCA-pyrophosphorylase [Buchnera aphidicola str. Ak (Acyrthosiphon kondoi)]